MSQVQSIARTPVTAPPPHPEQLIYVWELPVRVFHWLTAGCIIVLFLSGLYMASPVLSTPGEPYDHFLMATVRTTHFSAAFVFIVAFALRSYWFFVGNSYARSGFPYVWKPSWWSELFHEIVSYLTFRRAAAPRIGHNALAGVAYTLFPILLGVAQILTGVALYSETNPRGLLASLTGWVIPLLGGSFRVHMWHHMFAWMFIWFAIAHVYVIMFDSIRDRNSLVESMVTGYKTRREGRNDQA